MVGGRAAGSSAEVLLQEQEWATLHVPISGQSVWPPTVTKRDPKGPSQNRPPTVSSACLFSVGKLQSPRHSPSSKEYI